MFTEKLTKKAKIYLITVVVVELFSACLAIYIIFHPHETLARASSVTGIAKISNEHLPAAQKIADQVSKQRIKSTQSPYLLDVYVDVHGKVYAREFEGSRVILNEDPDFDNSKRLLGVIHFVQLPLNKTAATVMLTDDLEKTLGQTITIYTEKN